MPIIRYTDNYPTSDYALLNLFPDQMVKEKVKSSDDWIKQNMDYFYSVATQQYFRNRERLLKNYELTAGILNKADFGEAPDLQSYVETLMEAQKLPEFVKHYCILTPPLNTLKGELTNRPDNIYVKAFDEDSKSEEMMFRTDIIQQFIFQNAKERMASQLAAKGHQVESEEELNQLTSDQVAEYITSYTSLAERWGNTVLEYLKMKLSLKEKSEDAFTDFLKTASEFYLIYEDNSELGINVKVVNPIKAWYLTTSDMTYTSDPLDKTNGCYAGGIVEQMELSQILETFKLTDEEVKHLREVAQQQYFIDGRPSNLVNPRVTGPDSVFYNTYDPLVLQRRQYYDSTISGHNPNESFFTATSDAGAYGNKFMVVRAWWCSKKKLGKLAYIDENEELQVTYVDDTYKAKQHPREQSLEWTWVNQWYQGLKIGDDIYYAEPYDLLDYCPLIGTFYEPKNLDYAISPVDRMKHFQMLYNIAMNQLFQLLQKDLGMVFVMNTRHIPNRREGDPQDALEIWENEAREKGVVFIDDSSDNLQGISGFNQFAAHNLSRSGEIQARYQMAVEIRNECWKLIGLSEQRLGSVSASETATATNSALAQSYAQTEPLFAKHEYNLNKVYQALLDAALYKQSQLDQSILSGISSEGANQFVSVNGSDLKLRNLGVFVTSRAQDNRNLMELKQYAQAMLQNGMSAYDLALIHDTKSMRQIKDLLKRTKTRMEAMEEQAQAIEQQKVQQAQQQFEQAQQMAQLMDEKNKAFEAFQNEQDRISKEKIAYIQASSNQEASSPAPDMGLLAQEEQQNYQQYQLKLQELTQKQRQILTQEQLAFQKMALDKEKLQVEREKIASAERIAAKNKNKYDK